MTRPTLSARDLAIVERVLGMESGYVLGFVDRTFAHAMADFDVDIDRGYGSGSKAKRLRAFLAAAEPAHIAAVLEGLLAHRGSRDDDAEATARLASYREIIARLRGTTVSSPSAASAPVLTLAYVQEIETKTDQRFVASDFEGAITTARTLLEAVLDELERELAGAKGDHKGDLQAKFKAVGKCLHIDTEHADLDDNFKQVVRGLVQVVNGLAPIRNKMSDAHPVARKPAAHHARVIVNASKTIATFLIESYEYQRQKALGASAAASKGFVR